MALYPRIIGIESPKIQLHMFQSVLAEWARGKITGAQAQQIVEQQSGAPLTPQDVTDCQALVATVTSIPITGSAVVIADGRARRALRISEIDQVLLLADCRAIGYDTEAALRSKLGV